MDPPSTPINSATKNIHAPSFPIPPTPMLHKIGFGTGSSVYHLDRSPKAGTVQSPWAIKKINRRNINSLYSERLTKEAEILNSLNHPHIIGFRGFSITDDGREVLAMEECTQSLGDLIEKYREIGLDPFAPRIINIVVLGAAKALDYLHTEKNLLHGDIKSYNILIKGDFEMVKLCDFGVSLKLDSNGEAPVDDYIGTPCWSSPEALAEGPITAKTDIFALGLTIWEMIALKPPHVSEETSFEESLVLDDSFDSKMGTRPQLPEDKQLGPEYDSIIEIYKWCTEENYKDRPTAKDLVNKLETQK